ncbi:hypothetical protein B4U80_06279 [Leptotrombidium deliense]|uniref:Gustatory receptor n=1 Tax=Leptotrombidium deliense TaxID=299467 RepID=A0A443SW33_9ACAR|nr:hypothetical protein B4U80_06279 [Leptotrombidium deliense]
MSEARSDFEEILLLNGHIFLSEAVCDRLALFKTVNPILKILKVLGSWPREGDQFILRLNFWNGITLFILHFYTAHKFFNWMTVVKYTENVFTAFEQLTLITRTAVVAITFDRRFLLQQRITNLFDAIAEYPLFNVDHKITKLGRWIKHMIIGCWSFIALHVILAASLMFYKSTDGYVNWLFYGDAAANTPDIVIRLVMIADWALYLFLVICNECFSLAFYICLCVIIREKISDYNDFLTRLQRKNLVTESSQMQELYKLHSKLTSLVEALEENFSFPALLWIICIIFNICVKVEAIISGIRNSQFEEFGYVLLDIIYYIVSFIMLCFIASEIGDEKLEPIIAVTKIAQDGDICDWSFQQESQLLLSKINESMMMRLTGWSCFELNKTFMITILGAIATYTILVLQM